MGRKLDYIEWVVCGYAEDEIKVGNAMSRLLGINEEVVQDVKDSFQDPLEGEPA
jgi:hypothetical protein